MKCPVCDTDLSQYSYGGQTIDVCPECQGIWFDPGELKAVANEMIRQDVVPDQEAKDAFHVRSESTDRDEPKKLCPRCGELTEVFNYAYDSNVFLNKCQTCHGIWADQGEIEHVARYLKGNPAVNRYVESLAKKVVSDREQGLVSRLLRSRLLSGIVASVYLCAAIGTRDARTILNMIAYLTLTLACIWFSDAMGSYTGILSFPRPAITRRTPGIFIALAGWILLLMPLIAGIILAVCCD